MNNPPRDHWRTLIIVTIIIWFLAGVMQLMATITNLCF